MFVHSPLQFNLVQVVLSRLLGALTHTQSTTRRPSFLIWTAPSLNEASNCHTIPSSQQQKQPLPASSPLPRTPRPTLPCLCLTAPYTALYSPYPNTNTFLKPQRSRLLWLCGASYTPPYPSPSSPSRLSSIESRHELTPVCLHVNGQVLVGRTSTWLSYVLKSNTSVFLRVTLRRH